MDTDRRNCLKKSGSVTVEAAIVLTLFMMGMCSLISVGMAFGLKICVKSALVEEVRQLALKQNLTREKDADTEMNIRSFLVENHAPIAFIKDGIDGVAVAKTDTDNKEYLKITAKYIFKPFGADYFDISGIPITQSCFVHLWCGYIDGFFADTGDVYVYIAKNSNVYHLDRECSYIRLVIEPVAGIEVDKKRNDKGGKYYKCNICKSNITDSLLYITPDGSKYHSTIICSGLRRIVRAVKISEIGDRRPCSRCGR